MIFTETAWEVVSSENMFFTLVGKKKKNCPLKLLKGDLERDGSLWIEGSKLVGVMIAGVLRTREETVAKGRQKTQSSTYTQDTDG